MEDKLVRTKRLESLVNKAFEGYNMTRVQSRPVSLVSKGSWKPWGKKFIGLYNECREEIWANDSRDTKELSKIKNAMNIGEEDYFIAFCENHKTKKEKFTGAMMLKKIQDHVYESHIFFRKANRGQYAVTALEHMIETAFRIGGIYSLVSFIPENWKHTRIIANRVGADRLDLEGVPAYKIDIPKWNELRKEVGYA